MAKSNMSVRLLDSTAPTLWTHQKASKTFFAKIKRGFDLSDPGTGKTRVQAELFAERKNRKRMLIVCPKTLMHSAWGDDIEKFAPSLTVSFATATQREAAFAMKTDVVVINTDGVKWFIDKNKAEERRRQAYLKEFDTLVIDEITAFKHHTSLRSKAMAKIKHYFETRYGLTGTLTANSVMEAWHPSLIINDGKLLGDSYYHMRNHFQESEQRGPSPDHLEWRDKPGALQVVTDLLSPVSIRHAFEDVMKHVPANHRTVREFKLSVGCMRAYREMEDTCILAHEDPEQAVTAVHAASMRTKLLQIASGAVYTGGEDSAYRLVDPYRYELITELIENIDHSVVFFNWKHQRDELAKNFRSAHIPFALIDGSVRQAERDAIVSDYQAGKYQTLLLHPKTGAHGLTLTRGTTTVISSPIYEADLLKQAIHRIYRGDQRRVTNTILVQAKGTVEDLVYAKLNSRTQRMDDFHSMFKSRTPR